VTETLKAIEITDHQIAWLVWPFLLSLFFYDLLGEDLPDRERFSLLFHPPRFFWVESLNHGSFPLWNPYQFSGHAFLAYPVHAVLYPLNILFFLLPFDIAFNGIIMLHFFLGGLFTYLLLKDIRAIQRVPQSGLIFMLMGTSCPFTACSPFFFPVWTPLIVMFFRYNQGQGSNEIFAAISITLFFLGGGLKLSTDSLCFC
jgi:hypothetical protein